MAKHTFTGYLHDMSGVLDWVPKFEAQGIPTHVALKIAEARPFYEVDITGTYDDETGAIELIEVKST